jgi:hypothetical protein
VSVDKGTGCGGEVPITISHAFLDRVIQHRDEECMRKLTLNKDGMPEAQIYTWL